MLKGQRNPSFPAPRFPTCLLTQTSLSLGCLQGGSASYTPHHTILYKFGFRKARQGDIRQKQLTRHQTALVLGEGRALTLWFPGAHTYHNHRWAEHWCRSTLTAKWFQIPGQSLNICIAWLISPNKPSANDLNYPLV